MRKTIFAAATALGLAGCSAGADTTAAESAVTRFHQLLDGARYGDIYQTTAPDFRQSTSEAQFTSLLEQVHGRLGTVRGADRTGWQVNYNSSGHMVTLNYTTHFASGDAREDFIYRVSGGTANLVNYTVNSAAGSTGPSVPITPAQPAPAAETPPPPPEPGGDSTPPPVGKPPAAGGDVGGK